MDRAIRQPLQIGPLVLDAGKIAWVDTAPISVRTRSATWSALRCGSAWTTSRTASRGCVTRRPTARRRSAQLSACTAVVMFSREPRSLESFN